MTARFVSAFVLILTAGFIGLAGALTSMRMVDEVNERLPPDQQFPLLGWHHFEFQPLIREYRRLYPSGRLIARELALAAIAFVLFPAAGRRIR
jgi:hypothetical protein